MTVSDYHYVYLLTNYHRMLFDLTKSPRFTFDQKFKVNKRIRTIELMIENYKNNGFLDHDKVINILSKRVF